MASKLASVYMTDNEKEFIDNSWGAGTVQTSLEKFFQKVEDHPGHVNYIMFHYEDRCVEDHFHFNDDPKYDFIRTELDGGHRVTMLVASPMKYVSRTDRRNIYRIVTTIIWQKGG